MLSVNFFESLRFFDKDSVPVVKLKKIEKLLAQEPNLSVQRIAEVSAQKDLNQGSFVVTYIND